MEWSNRIEGAQRDYIEIEYKVKNSITNDDSFLLSIKNIKKKN